MANTWQARQYIMKLDAFFVNSFGVSHLPGFNMSSTSIADSIKPILEKATYLAGFLLVLQDWSSEHDQIYREIIVLHNLLSRAYSKAQDSNASHYWFSSVQFLTRQDGVFDQTTEVLESMARKVTVRTAWPFDQGETKRIWERIRGTNKLLDFALDSVESKSAHPLLI